MTKTIKENATLVFPSRKMAQKFVSQYTIATLKGHSMSATKDNGKTTVKLYDVQAVHKLTINDIVKQLETENQ